MRAKATAYGDLTFPQTLALAIGPKNGALPFADEADARAAWASVREDMIARSAFGMRPSAFWAFDVGAAELDDEDAEPLRWAWLLDHPEHLRLGEARWIRRQVETDLAWCEAPAEEKGWPPPSPEELERDRLMAERLRAIRGHPPRENRGRPPYPAPDIRERHSVSRRYE